MPCQSFLLRIHLRLLYSHQDELAAGDKHNVPADSSCSLQAYVHVSYKPFTCLRAVHRNLWGSVQRAWHCHAVRLVLFMIIMMETNRPAGVVHAILHRGFRWGSMGIMQGYVRIFILLSTSPADAGFRAPPRHITTPFRR